MVNGDAVKEAVEIARAQPSLGVGVHLTLVLGRATLPPQEIPDLVDGDGRFLGSPARAGMRYFFHRAAREQVRRELRAQIEKFLATGLQPTHLDSHTMLHMHPTIWPMVADLAQEFGVPRVRWPRESLRLALRLDGGRTVAKLGYFVIFSALRARARADLRARTHADSLRQTDLTFGLMQTGAVNEGYLCALLEQLPEGNSAVEIYLHPDTVATENPNGPAELAALCSARVRRTLESRGWSLAGKTTAEAVSP